MNVTYPKAVNMSGIYACKLLLALVVAFSVVVVMVNATAAMNHEGSHHLEFSIQDISYAECLKWQGAYDYSSTNSQGQLVQSGASPCDSTSCCCWQSFVRVGCENYGGESNIITIDIDSIVGDSCNTAAGNAYSNTAVYWSEVTLSAPALPFLLNSTKYSIGGAHYGAVANNVLDLDSIGNAEQNDPWNLYFYVVNGSTVLSALNGASSSCSAMFTMVSTDSMYQYPSSISFNFPLVAFLVALGEASIVTGVAVTLLILSRKFPQWRIFISDEETRRNARAARIKKKAERAAARKQAKERKENERAWRDAASQQEHSPRSAGQNKDSGGKLSWVSKKAKKPKDAKEAAAHSESAAFYHQVAHESSSAVLEKMEARLGGLSAPEVEQRLVKYGKNIPAKEDRFAVLKYFVKSLVNPFNFLLVSLSVLTYTFPPPGDLIGGSIILFMVVLSVVITFVQDYRSNNAIAKLKSMVKATTVVYRRIRAEDKMADAGEAKQGSKSGAQGGQEIGAMSNSAQKENARESKTMKSPMASASPPQPGDAGNGRASTVGGLVSKRLDVDVTDIVPGDILFLTAGSVIPADVRIISCKDLFVAQSALTGESFPVEKSANATLDKEEHKPAPKAAVMTAKKLKEKHAPKKHAVKKVNSSDVELKEAHSAAATAAAASSSASADEPKAPLIEQGSDAAFPESGASGTLSTPSPDGAEIAVNVSDRAGADGAEAKKANPLDALSDERFFDTTTGEAFGGDQQVVPRSGRLNEDEEDADEEDSKAVELSRSRSAVHWYMENVEGYEEEDLPSTERIDTSQIHLHLDSRLRNMDDDDAARQHIEPIVTGLKDAVAAAMSEHSRLKLEKKDDEENELQAYEASEESDEEEDDDNSESEADDEEKRQSKNGAEKEKDKSNAEVAIELPRTNSGAPPTEKAAAAPKSDSIFEHANLAFMGSSVTSGVATAVVIRTGTKTVLGELATMLTAMKPPTSFEKGIAAYVMLMFKFMIGMGIFVTIVNGLTGKGWFNAFGFAITVAIGLTPEMLPVVITVNLAKGAMDLLARKVIVKRLISVQNLGAIEVLCTDKTGTLTDDRIQLYQYLDVDGNVQPSVLVKAAVNSSFQTAFRNMLDENVIQKAEDHQPAAMKGVKQLSKVDEIPFDFNRKRMSVIVQQEREHILICKGAAEEMIKLSTSMAKFSKPLDGKEVLMSPACIINDDNVTNEKVDADKRNELIGAVHKMNGQGFRVVCVAMKRMSASSDHTYGVNDEKDLTLFGFLVFLDPPKEGVEKSIESLRHRGVHIKVCTGDNEKVTHYVCQRIGIPVNRILLGAEIGRMSDESLQKAVHECDIFAKLSPLDKERVVKAIKATGRSVGFLGDGVNDAAALKAADVGISVDNAVEIAKESADVILLTKSLDVLDRGVLLGRISFANIIKYIKMAASSNFGNMFSVLGLSVMLPVTPLQPVQILVNNLLYDVSQIALPFDSVDDEWVARPRQWDMKDLTSFIMLIGPTSSVFDYLTWAMSWYILGYHVNTRKATISAQTVWWMESLFSQTLIVHLIRTTKIPFLQSRASGYLIGTTLLIMAISCILPYIPGTDAIPLHTVDTQVFGWLVVLMMGYWTLTSFIKSMYYRIWPNSSC